MTGRTPPTTTRARGRHPAARLAMLAAVLLGLFLMHGGPAAADGGCHGTMTAPAPIGHTVSTGDHATAHHQTTQPAAARAATVMDGALCTATAPRTGVMLPIPALAAILAPAAGLLPYAWPAARDGRHRGPPAGGRDLLHQVCIART